PEEKPEVKPEEGNNNNQNNNNNNNNPNNNNNNQQEAKTVVDSFKTIENNQQVILVTSKGYGTNNAQIRTFDKTDGKWKELKNINGKIGKDGFAKQMSEEVTQSPRGKYTIGMAFGRQGNPGTKLKWHDIQPNDVWVDDSKSELYNTLQQKPSNGRWNSAENMNIPAYDYGFVINYNTDRVAGKGSAIFFHVSNTWTAGCTGASKQDVIDILKWIDPAKNPVIIQAPESELGNY
ncbi:L,D-transpeptidase family protein, partial [Bacillus sp. JJ864]|uniref:L,D-transpeptidase family protein n=2 Tax=Bacillus TaxID=1386 RepID=UPI002FFF59D1